MGTDILFSASDLCAEDDRIFALGMNLANEYSAYETIRKEINKSLSLGSKLKVVSLGNNSPASKAGILVGDEILEIDGESLIQGEDAFKSYIEKIDKGLALQANSIHPNLKNLKWLTKNDEPRNEINFLKKAIKLIENEKREIKHYKIRSIICEYLFYKR